MANPHFVRASANCTGNNLRVCFKETGLGSNQTVTISASATATVDFQCINNGGKNPSAGNKETVVEDVFFSGTFTADQSGTVSACETVPAPGPGDFTCPSGQHLVMGEVTYTNIQVTDNTTGAFIDIPGTIVC